MLPVDSEKHKRGLVRTAPWPVITACSALNHSTMTAEMWNLTEAPTAQEEASSHTVLVLPKWMELRKSIHSCKLHRSPSPPGCFHMPAIIVLTGVFLTPSLGGIEAWKIFGHFWALIAHLACLLQHLTPAVRCHLSSLEYLSAMQHWSHTHALLEMLRNYTSKLMQCTPALWTYKSPSGITPRFHAKGVYDHVQCSSNNSGCTQSCNP